MSTLEMGAAQHCSATEKEPKSPFLCTIRSPIWYGFHAGPKAIRYNVNIASHFLICKIHSLKSILASKEAKNSSLDLSHD